MHLATMNAEEKKVCGSHNTNSLLLALSLIPAFLIAAAKNKACYVIEFPTGAAAAKVTQGAPLVVCAQPTETKEVVTQ